MLENWLTGILLFDFVRRGTHTSSQTCASPNVELTAVILSLIISQLSTRCGEMYLDTQATSLTLLSTSMRVTRRHRCIQDAAAL